MKRKILFLLVLFVAAMSCGKPTQDNPMASQYAERCEVMQHLIDAGVDYDVTAVGELFLEGADYWQLDAILGYDAGYTKVERIYRDFANSEFRDDDDLIFAFCSNGVIHCSDINAEDGTIVEQVGDWSYNGRTLELVISVQEFGDNITMEFRAKLLSLTPESAVLEWSGNDGEALRASLRPASYDEHQKKSVNIIAAKIVSKCSNYTAKEIEQGLPGEWELYCDFAYDNDWQSVEDAFVVLGIHYAAGASYPKYIFEDGGTGYYSQRSTLPPFETAEVAFEWNYNAESGCLELNCEGGYKIYIVSGYCNEYLIFNINGSGPANKNHKLVYKRIC